jgi:hypothetical protein
VFWFIGAGFLIDVPLDRAVLSFEWLFDAMSDSRFRLEPPRRHEEDR